MINRLANPLSVKQAPDARAIMKTTTLSVESQPLSTPPFAQQYFEPGVNVKKTHRSKPKTNYSLPSDMPTYPIDFVPTNKTPGANGEEPSIIAVKEAVPADLLQVFARIAAEEQALASIPKSGTDSGQEIATAYMNAIQEKNISNIFDTLVAEGYDEEMIEDALYENKMEALKLRLKNKTK